MAAALPVDVGLGPTLARLALVALEASTDAIAPGPTMTDATKQGVPEDIIGMIVQFQMAFHRPLQPDDVTGTAVWLASDDSAMVTG
jgi:NAD(P)-dependent dehydrogenase (short-subunit alcohol dehydrogenase family)